MLVVADDELMAIKIGLVKIIDINLFAGYYDGA